MKRTRQHPRNLRRAFTLVEVVLSTTVVAVLLAAALDVAGRAAVVQYKLADRQTGRFLADALMSDILLNAYEEPNGTPAFGRETGELGSSKANYDDVDDFNGWSESPPQERDGTVMSGLSGWQRSVLVERVTPADPTQVVASESGAKRITVIVKHKGIPVATRVAIRTSAPE